MVQQAFGFRTEEWRVAGLRSRPDGPAVIEYSFDGRILAEEWFSGGRLHRVGGPAVKRFDADGSVVLEEWWVEGNLSRLPGTLPARTNENYLRPIGRREEHYVDGWHVFDPGTWGKTFAGLREDRRRRALSASPYAVLLDEGLATEAIAAAFLGGVTSIEGVREVAAGAPPEWILSFEDGAA